MNREAKPLINSSLVAGVVGENTLWVGELKMLAGDFKQGGD